MDGVRRTLGKVWERRASLTSHKRMIGLAAVVVVGAAVLAGRYTGTGNLAGAEGDEGSGPIDEQATPAPGQTPDTSKPFWYLPWGNLEGNLPRYEQFVAGITLGPGLHGGVACDGPVEPVSADAARGSVVYIAPGYLPDGAVRGENSTEACAGEAVFQEVVYYIQPDPSDMSLVAAGVKTFFEAQHGGAVDIMRIKLREPKWDPGFPSGRIEEGIVSGMPAAIGVPILPEGWGTGFIIVYDPTTGVLTRVGGSDLTVAELRKIAEDLLK